MSDASYHTKPGESSADPHSTPSIVLFMFGLLGLASTLTAAAFGLPDWTKLGAATALLFLASLAMFVLEFERQRRLAARRTGTETAPE
ncbi:hypothetical protein ACQP1G_23230 [Nocardia sp. CA-107356]|uniref:hypothetical protein n=1 Tax=Nocardia sp. CA-107356 TaxID=3239972 RepID=UPI003D913B70